MSLTAKDTGSDFVLTPTGNHLGICYLLVGLGRQETNFGIKEQVLIGWELPNELMEDGRPFAISKQYTLSTNEKANLRKDLEAWRGRSFSEAEVESFNLKNILGKPCMVAVIHNNKNNKTYANVASIASVPKGMNVPKKCNETVCYDVDEPEETIFKKLPEWIQKKVLAAIQLPQRTVDNNELNPPDFIDEDIPF